MLTGWKIDIKGEGEKKKEAADHLDALAEGRLAMSDDNELVEVDKVEEDEYVDEVNTEVEEDEYVDEVDAEVEEEKVESEETEE